MFPFFNRIFLALLTLALLLIHSTSFAALPEGVFLHYGNNGHKPEATVYIIDRTNLKAPLQTMTLKYLPKGIPYILNREHHANLIKSYLDHLADNLKGPASGPLPQIFIHRFSKYDANINEHFGTRPVLIWDKKNPNGPLKLVKLGDVAEGSPYVLREDKNKKNAVEAFKRAYTVHKYLKKRRIIH